MTMQTETKLIATEKMSVKEIRKNGNTAQNMLLVFLMLTIMAYLKVTK